MHQRRPDWDHITFASSLPATARAAVETLFFFNPRQGLLANAINAAIELTGTPEIREANDRIWLATRSGSMQCLFACDSRGRDCPPVGVALYFRPAPHLISITHLAIGVGYTANANSGELGLGNHVVNQVKQIARSIRGVSRIQLPYRKGAFLPVVR